eukprot:TRINITY_DN49250_c0_g1_i1.p1 TRINITY_DN49250_c0_g1~~TRINITY_DN49250_c0_g1_i1.p1  ORF type:complete len:558 (+),score=126.80 TRINITY_DN49250_c0_g1_i1:286-1959(+)
MGAHMCCPPHATHELVGPSDVELPTTEKAVHEHHVSSFRPSQKEGRRKSGIGIDGSLVVNRGNFVHRGKVGGNIITDKYELAKTQMGEGSYGSVCKGIHKDTKAVRAVKTMRKGKLKDVQNFQTEIETMTQLDHPNIIRLYETFEDAKSIYLVMELCEGGELFDRITDQGSFSEKDCATLMKQILAGIFYCHMMQICHRDLKPENFLFGSPAKDSYLKIIDFGLAKHFTPEAIMTTKVGTPYYVAPQVLEGRYTEKCDIWSCGVIMYILLCGYPPFYGDTDHQIFATVRSGKFSFPQDDWANVSDEAKKLIRVMLTRDQHDRCSAEAAFNDSWVQAQAQNALNVPLKVDTMRRFHNFKTVNRLKKVAMTVIAQHLPDSEIDELKRTFLSLDTNGDGTLTLPEIRLGMEKQGLEIPHDLEELMSHVDSDDSGVIDYTEWITATMDRRHYIQEDVCWNAFRTFDLDCDGVINKHELRSMLAGEEAQEIDNIFGHGLIEAMLADADINGDGVIDFEEFVELIGSNNVAVSDPNSPVPGPGKPKLGRGGSTLNRAASLRTT